MTTSPTVSYIKFLALLFITLISVACTDSNKSNLVSVENRYSISLPSFLTEVHNLNEDASLQYQHAWKEFYIIVIEDSKEEIDKVFEEYDMPPEYSNTLQGYTNLVLHNINQNSSISSVSVEDTTINQLPAKLFTTTEKIDGIDVYYSVAVIKSDDYFYQIMTWTLSSKKYQYKDQMEDILRSFKEI